jgi:glycosyltransferase involved in cell wall biosynthesis
LTSGAAPRVDLTVAHPLDPWQPGIGGYGTFIPDLIREAPREWTIELIGVTRDPAARPVGRWLELRLANRPVRFFAAMADRSRGPRRIPLSLSFVLACRRHRVTPAGRSLHLHRFESALAFPRRDGQCRTLFLHADPVAQRRAESAGRWTGLGGFHDRLLLRVARSTDRVWCVDRGTPNWLDEKLPERAGAHREIELWTADEAFTPYGDDGEESSWRRRLEVTDGGAWITWAARQEPQKDPLWMVEGFARLAAAHRNLNLVMVGDGSLGGAVKARIRALGLETRVRLPGALPRVELASLLRTSRLFLCTSRYESGPFSVLEALACGCPVVSADVGRAREWLAAPGPAGRLISERTAPALARGIEEALVERDDLASRCGAIAKRYTLQRALEPVFAAEREPCAA